MTRRLLLMLSTVALALGLAAPAASAAPSPVRADVRPVADLLDGGQGVRIYIKASCPEGYQVLEALAYVVQDGMTSSMRGFTIPCDGRKHSVTVEVISFDAPFTGGKAFVTSFLLVIDAAGQETISGGERRQVDLR